MIINHLTDVEGNLRYFEQWVNRSNYLQFNQNDLAFTDYKLEQAFVYGGDFCDKGPGDIRIGQLLVHFKKRNPHHVFLIAGNREIKCRRFSYELTANIRQRLLYKIPPFWNQQSVPLDYVVQQMRAEGNYSTAYSDIVRFVENKSIQDCQTIYLHWMLNQTMGCGSFHNKPTTFEYRRRELAECSGKQAEDISDVMVTQSFIDSVSSEGFARNYLKNAQLAKIIGETLFIHGAVTPENMGFVPGMNDSQPRCDNAKEWLAALNDWYTRQINEWLEQPVEDYLHPPGHKPLDHYVIANPKSIVTSNWYTENQLKPIAKGVIKFLNKAGIYRVVCGHQPFADFPLIIRNPNLEVIVGDTSYSAPKAKNDNRGEAIHNLTIFQFDNESYASIDAIRKDGSTMQLNLPSRLQVSQGNDSKIGHFIAGNRLIRPLNSTVLVSSQLDGFIVRDEALD